MTTDDIGLTPIHLEWWWLNQHISLIGRIHVLATKISCYTAAALALHTLLSTGDVLGWTFFAHSLAWSAYQEGDLQHGHRAGFQTQIQFKCNSVIMLAIIITKELVTLLHWPVLSISTGQQLKGPESSTRIRHASINSLDQWIFLKPEHRHRAFSAPHFIYN